MAIAYLARRGGPVTEAQDPYSETSNVSPSGLTPSKYLQEALRIPARGSYTDNDAIKSALMTYGAVASDIYWKDSAYSSANDSYYCGNCAGSNHEQDDDETHPVGAEVAGDQTGEDVKRCAAFFRGVKHFAHMFLM